MLFTILSAYIIGVALISGISYCLKDSVQVGMAVQTVVDDYNRENNAEMTSGQFKLCIAVAILFWPVILVYGIVKK